VTDPEVVELRRSHTMGDTLAQGGPPLGELSAYKMARVIGILRNELDAFAASSRIAPGTLEHLEPPLNDFDES
jgi:hypothetical protein